MLRRESIYSMASTSFKLLSGPLAIMLITTKLTPLEQGVYYMFLSLSAIQWIFELGISTCITQHIAASKNEINRKRYIDFLKFFLLLSSILLLVFLIFVSFFIFSDVDRDYWLHAWIIYAAFVSANLFFNSLVIIEEGEGSIENAYLTKMFGGFSYSIALIISLILGYGLFSLCFAQFSMLITVVLKLRDNLSKLVIKINSKKLHLFKLTLFEVLEFQSKLSIVWIAGYLYWNSFQWLFFKYISPEVSGNFGATNGVFGALAMIAISLVSTQRARWGRYNEDALKGAAYTYRLFKRELVKGLLLFSLTSFLIILIFVLLPQNDIKARFLSIFPLILLALFRFFVLFQEFVLIYLRTFKDEPLYKITLVNYISLPLAVLLGVKFNSISISLIGSIFFQVVFCFIYFINMKKYISQRHFNG